MVTTLMWKLQDAKHVISVLSVLLYFERTGISFFVHWKNDLLGACSGHMLVRLNLMSITGEGDMHGVLCCC